MARPKKPNALKSLQGTNRADRKNGGIEVDKLSVLPEAPKYLSKKSQEAFVSVCQMLKDKDLLYSWDLQMLIMLAEEIATYEQACGKLKTATSKVVSVGENGYQQQSPWLGIRNNALKNIKEISARFGFDPLSREKFGASQAPKEDKNPFENL